jgi:hypothetical protein
MTIESMRIAELEMQVAQYKKLFGKLAAAANATEECVSVADKIDTWISLVDKLKEERSALHMEVDRLRRAILSDGKNVDFNVFIGPCIHGHDPYDRCGICGDLGPYEALLRGYQTAIKTVACISRDVSTLAWTQGEPEDMPRINKAFTRLINVMRLANAGPFTQDSAFLDEYYDETTK